MSNNFFCRGNGLANIGVYIIVMEEVMIINRKVLIVVGVFVAVIVGVYTGFFGVNF